MINHVEVESITKIRWKLKIQMLMNKRNIQGFNQVKDSEAFKTFKKRSRRRSRRRKRYNSQGTLLKYLVYAVY